MSENTPDPDNVPDPNTPEPNTPDPDNEPDEYTAPEKEEWERTTASLAKIKAERTKLRKELAEARAGKPKPDEKPDEKDEPKEDPELRVKKVAVTSALVGIGLTKTQARRAARLVDMSDVEVDEDGDAELDDVIADLKSEFPGLFPEGGRAGSGPRPRTSGGRSRDAGEKKSADERTSEAMLKGAGFR